VPFFQPIVHLAANNRFLRRFVWVQKGVACECWQNEYLFENTAICTYLGAICYKTKYFLPLNAVHFGAKRKVKCR